MIAPDRRVLLRHAVLLFIVISDLFIRCQSQPIIEQFGYIDFIIHYTFIITLPSFNAI